MWISLCFIDSFATFECSKLNKRLDCSNDCVRFHRVCAYDNSASFKTNVIIGISHLWIVNLSIVNRELVISICFSFKRFDFVRHSQEGVEKCVILSIVKIECLCTSCSYRYLFIILTIHKHDCAFNRFVFITIRTICYRVVCPNVCDSALVRITSNA